MARSRTGPDLVSESYWLLGLSLMLGVADTSPLNYLVWIGVVEILPGIFNQILIPGEVSDELLALDAPASVREWMGRLPSWVTVLPHGADLEGRSLPASLHKGERAAIATAASNRPSVLLIDERAGRAIARSMVLSVTGTLGILEEAARRKLTSFPRAIESLTRTSFRYPKGIVARLLAEDALR